MMELNGINTDVVLAVIVGAAGIVSWAGTLVVRRYALARSILDIPNHRSSHTVPTPRGGGLGLLLGFYFGLVTATATGFVEVATAIGIGFGSLLVAAVGWLDDRHGVPPLYRALVHLAAATWTVAWLGGLSAVGIVDHRIDLGVAGSFIAIVAIVWCTNLYNFMDGIDGIAGGQAAASGVCGAILLTLNHNPGLATIAWLIAAASVGFLIWNWAPAKIFLGDVGSGALGFVFGAIAIAGEREGSLPLAGSLLLGGTFVFDATVTLFRRLGRRARWYEAHRSHAYQRAVQAGMSHAIVAGGYVLATLGFGSALIVVNDSSSGQLAVVGAGFAALAALYLVVERRRPMDGDHRVPIIEVAHGGVDSRQEASPEAESLATRRGSKWLVERR